MSKQLYEEWKAREKASDFDNKLLKFTRTVVPEGYKLVMLSVPEPRPWDTVQHLIAVMIRPWHLIAGYANPTYITIHDEFFHSNHVGDIEVRIHFLSLHEWITKMLEGNFDTYFAFRWWARAWFIDSHMRMQAQKLMQYCMSKQTITNSIFSMEIELGLLFRADTNHITDPFHNLSRIVFWVGGIKYLFKTKNFASDHIIATNHLNSHIIDNVLFARYDNVELDPVITYLKGQMLHLISAVETTNLQDKPDMAYISGSVHQIRLMYALK